MKEVILVENLALRAGDQTVIIEKVGSVIDELSYHAVVSIKIHHLRLYLFEFLVIGQVVDPNVPQNDPETIEGCRVSEHIASIEALSSQCI